MSDLMKRDDALIPLTHDHHHALAQARRLRASADNDDPADRMARAREFLSFFADDTIQHFREEEEQLFPLLLQSDGPPPDVLVQILIEHVRMHAEVRRLDAEVVSGSVESATLRGIGELLQSHIRLEEGTLFPLIERLVTDEDLGRVRFAPRRRATGRERG